MHTSKEQIQSPTVRTQISAPFLAPKSYLISESLEGKIYGHIGDYGSYYNYPKVIDW